MGIEHRQACALSWDRRCIQGTARGDGYQVISELALAIQFSVGIVFLLSSLSKLRHPHRFVRSAVAYAVLPTRMTRALALALIPVEAFLAVAFLTGRIVAVALPLAAATLLVFLVAVSINLRRGRRIPCGCFGQASEPISLRTITRLLMLLGAIGLLAAIRSSALTPLPAPRLVTCVRHHW
uniref:Methylamine utilisation protein MauE domain-containing protein n=1 Tax=Thermorudis peleae TaxID=1382356 RepID=A0A831TDW5_9BACT